MKVYIYSDGGQSGPNPSYAGGAWAYRIVTHANEARGSQGDGGRLGPPDSPDDVVHLENSGVLIPHDLGVPAITNNHVELRAICEATIAVGKLSPAPSVAVFCPDSAYALTMLFQLKRYRNLTRPLVYLLRQAWTVIEGLPFDLEYELLAGHPEEGKVIDGLKFKGNGVKERIYRVSRHNGEIDALCTELCAGIAWPTPEEINERQGEGLFTVGEMLSIKR